MAAKVIKKIISTPNAPGAIGAYSQAVQAGNMLFVSGQLGRSPETMELVEGVESQTDLALKNMGIILEAAGCSFTNVVKTTVLLADINDFTAMNKVYMKYFTNSLPARAAYQVAALPMGGRVEIEAIALVGDFAEAKM